MELGEKSLPENEVQREGRRVLRRLALTRGELELDPRNKDQFILRVRGADMYDSRVAAPVVAEFAKRGWVMPQPDGQYRLSEAGEAWLARAQCSEGDPFAFQHRAMTHREITTDTGETAIVEVNDAESPLAWMYRRKAIDSAQFAAGEKLRRDFTLAGLSPRMTRDLSAPVVDSTGSGALELSETVIAAKQRFARAMRAAGPHLCDLLFDVCCHLRGIESVERAMGWPRRSAKVVLRIALNKLAEHYGFQISAPDYAPMRNWRAELGLDAGGQSA